MRLLHLSDLHLGFRQFQRTTPTGINQREADVAASFKLAVDKVIALRPEIVVIAGDIFHTVRPSNQAILFAFQQFSRLTQELPDAAIVVVSGNHDLPRSTDTRCILRLFEPLGIRIADTAAQSFSFPELELEVLAVPDVPWDERKLAPTGAAKFNVMVLHGEVEGASPDYGSSADRVVLKIPAAEVNDPAWSYVALGHQHVYQRIGPRAFYSGATDYTSTNVWGEIADQKAQKLPGKGMIEFNLESGKHTFHPIAPVVRQFVDLPPIEGAGMSSEDLDAAIERSILKLPDGIDNKVVRLIAKNVQRHIALHLDHKVLKELRKRALHFHFDRREPEPVVNEAGGAPGHRPSLAEIVRDKLRSRELTSDIDRDQLVRLGMHYLHEAEQASFARGLSSAAEEET